MLWAILSFQTCSSNCKPCSHPLGLKVHRLSFLHRQSHLSLLVLCLFAPFSNKKPLPQGCTSRSLGHNDLWRGRYLCRDFPCRSHSHLPEVPFLPSSLNLKRVALMGSFLPSLSYGESGKKRETLFPLEGKELGCTDQYVAPR